eukprot:CAMPEP_0185041040 /NCGR_PEP_ID=MMETSP1103-20130426/39833_1 /TAXON_ID=36769 /ORGANISM="Paraphysomonas bandaiensis, Strain Caron Lab Isolate" /LENGTH=389 /DNA_ID=CAMNT_0027580609 /DNA_START=87 /DNA_END=1256 /DNA_ORIENTATION=-
MTCFTRPTGVLRTVSNVTLEVNKRDIKETRIVRESTLNPVQTGEVRLQVDKFSLTANTVTYAWAGDKLGYWDFFPSESSLEWGRVPAMGWATVIESLVPNVTVGEKYFGWYPMSKYVTITGKAKPDGGFLDVGEHRAKHAQVYVDFSRTDVDPFNVDDTEDGEDRQALLRGLFLTSFLADEFFRHHKNGEYLGAEEVYIISASSKTALGIAQRISVQRRPGSLPIKTIGITSLNNVDFVKSTGYFDRVIPYDNVHSLCGNVGAVIIDMSGNWDIVSKLHEVLGENLKYSMSIGKSHHDNPTEASVVRGPPPTLFFAPAEFSSCVERWGLKEFISRSKEALGVFVAGSREWMKVQHVYGPEGVKDQWRLLVDGKVSPNTGVVGSMFCSKI